MKNEKDSQEQIATLTTKNKASRNLSRSLQAAMQHNKGKARRGSQYQQRKADKSLWEKIRSKDSAFWQAVLVSLASSVGSNLRSE